MLLPGPASKRAGVILVLLGAAGSLALPTSAPAWKQTLADRFYPGIGAPGGVAQVFTARKCSGPMLGTYQVIGRTVSTGDVEVVVRLNLPVTPAWKRVTGVAVMATGLDKPLPPPLPANGNIEVDRALTQFYSTMFARWTPGRLHVRHQGLTVFGRQTVAPAQVSFAFAPKPGC